MTITVSPLIDVQGAGLTLTANGDLVMAPDIQTQFAVTAVQYNCMYKDNADSGLIPYLNGLSTASNATYQVTNILKNAYQQLIAPGIISNLQISINRILQNANYITINASALANNTTVAFSYTNAE